MPQEEGKTAAKQRQATLSCRNSAGNDDGLVEPWFLSQEAESSSIPAASSNIPAVFPIARPSTPEGILRTCSSPSRPKPVKSPHVGTTLSQETPLSKGSQKKGASSLIRAVKSSKPSPLAKTKPHVKEEHKIVDLQNKIEDSGENSKSKERCVKGETRDRIILSKDAERPRSPSSDIQPPIVSISDQRHKSKVRRPSCEDDSPIVVDLPSSSLVEASNTGTYGRSRKRPRSPEMLDLPEKEMKVQTQHESLQIKTPRSGCEVLANSQSPEKLSFPESEGKRYHITTFDYVVSEVVARYQHVLSASDLKIVDIFSKSLSLNAKNLFVRLYRRQPRWHRADNLQEDYSESIDVLSAMKELALNDVVLSTKGDCVNSDPNCSPQDLAIDLLHSVNLNFLRSMCASVANGKDLRKLTREKLIPQLQAILSDSTLNSKERYRQTTITGEPPSLRLAHTILQKIGHCIKIPTDVLISVQRIHFLFFLDAGHDSPNLILANTGKIRFPQYECLRETPVFPSANALESYENAIALESKIKLALDEKDFKSAAYIGSIADLEVREFLKCMNCQSSSHCIVSKPIGRSTLESTQTLKTMCDFPFQEAREIGSSYNVLEVRRQLEHPLFRRYTAYWVYANIAWLSVDSLEKLREYESAVDRLKLLLSTRVMPKRRGKFLERLTINLSKHLNRRDHALGVIIDALQPDAPFLHFGDRNVLASRGAELYREINLAAAEAGVTKRISGKMKRKQAARNALEQSRPDVISKTLCEREGTIAVRTIHGRALTSASKEEAESSWTSAGSPSNAINSVPLSRTPRRRSSSGRKSRFIGFGSESFGISVEELALEWHNANENWEGIHDEGKVVRFLFALLLWDSALFATVPDVFQTPFQNFPLDLHTEAFYSSRKLRIEDRLEQLRIMTPDKLREEVLNLYSTYEGTRCVGCHWDSYTADTLAEIAAGIGGEGLTRVCRILAMDYNYWSGGFCDLVLWKAKNGAAIAKVKFVEVKSARDVLSERQKAWLIELTKANIDCEVFKVVEKITKKNEATLAKSELDYVSLSALDNRRAEK